jgi:hypothetical protein
MGLAVAEVQQGKTGSTVTTLAATVFTTSPNVGDLIVVFVATEAGTLPSHTAPTDSAGHTATQVGSQQSGGIEGLSVWVFENITVGTGLSSYIVTAHWGTSSGTLVVVRVTGNNTPTSYNGDIVQNSLTAETSSTNPSVGPTTVAPANQSIFFGCVASDTAPNANYTDGTNIAWTHVTNEVQTDNTTFDDLYVEHFINSDATKQTAQWVGATAPWFALVCSFAPAPTAAVSVQHGVISKQQRMT